MDVAGRRALAESVGKVRSRIQQILERSESVGEQDTKATLIEPILSALGWRLDELDEVRREYKYKSQDNPVDYALFVLRQPRLFVEAKPFGSALGRKCASQVLGYASVMGVGWCVVTNGDEYRLYNSHVAVDVDEKLFRTVCLSDPAQEAYTLETLGLIAKDTMGDNALESLWTSQFVDRRVKAALEEAFRDEDGGLTRLLRKRAPKLSPAEIRDSLKRVDLRVSFPVVMTLPIQSSPAGQPLASAPAPAPSVTQSSRGPRITPRSLIQAGLIKAPFSIEATYKGAQLTASIDANGSVVFAGTSHGSLSAAGGAAKASVNLSPSGEPFPATNGWTFWQYRDPATGRSVPMDRLYQRFVEPQGERTSGTT